MRRGTRETKSFEILPLTCSHAVTFFSSFREKSILLFPCLVTLIKPTSTKRGSKTKKASVYEAATENEGCPFNSKRYRGHIGEVLWDYCMSTCLSQQPGAPRSWQTALMTSTRQVFLQILLTQRMERERERERAGRRQRKTGGLTFTTKLKGGGTGKLLF